VIRFEGIRRRYDLRDQRPVEIAGAVLSDTVQALVSASPQFMRNGRKEAFVSLVTPDYRWGMLAWLRSLRKVSDRAVILLVPRAIDVPADIPDVFVVEVPELFNETYVPGRPQYAHVLTKIWIFALTALDRLVFVDIDCLFLGNVDALFDSSQFLAVPNSLHSLGTGRFNSGVLAFCPSPNLRRNVFRKIAELESHMGGDEDALNQILLDDVVFMDEKYNLFRHFHYFGDDKNRTDTRILHFVIKKPWEMFYRETGDGMLVYLDDLWTGFLSDSERSDLIAFWRRHLFTVNEQHRIEKFGAEQIEPLLLRTAKLEKQLEASRLIQWLLTALTGLAAGAFLAMIFLR
jgi:Glycosyl transferase family 8